jgi:glycine/D-amino acid oxidase-like deaminating enzyme/nitrite reductase/ring-hydroxylating ferredoxin subunit
MNQSNSQSAKNLFTSGDNIPYWIASEKELKHEKLNGEMETEVLIVGGGIAGLTTAYLLLKENKSVVLVEDGYLGSGESGRTTAHITCALDDRYYELEKIFGQEKTNLIANSHQSAIERIAEIIATENIDCHFKRVDGYLFLHPSDSKENLDKEFNATQNAGIDTRLVAPPLQMGNKTGDKCIQFPNQAQFHITKYLAGLAKAVIQMGGKIYTESKAENISKKGATINGFQVKASHVVVATNTPVNDWFTMHTKQWPYRTYVIGVNIPKGQMPYSLWWDTGDQNSKWITKPYHYVRIEELDAQHDLLIIGGEDHKTGQAKEENIAEEERYTRLYEWAKSVFTSLGDVVYKWSGQVMEPVDCLAFLGQNPGDENVYIITGDSGNGMTHTTIGAMLITDSITGKENPWTDLYDPSRITLNTTGDYLRETGNMASQLTDWFNTLDLKDKEQLTPGQGGVYSKGLSKIALYRDENKCLHAYSGTCPHMGGVLQWNADEKSFDCPLHGSRFTKEGKVVNGPAMDDLKSMDEGLTKEIMP